MFPYVCERDLISVTRVRARLATRSRAFATDLPGEWTNAPRVPRKRLDMAGLCLLPGEEGTKQQGDPKPDTPEYLQLRLSYGSRPIHDRLCSTQLRGVIRGQTHRLDQIAAADPYAKAVRIAATTTTYLEIPPLRNVETASISEFSLSPKW